jgi:hypothetical protein
VVGLAAAAGGAAVGLGGLAVPQALKTIASAARPQIIQCERSVNRTVVSPLIESVQGTTDGIVPTENYPVLDTLVINSVRDR